MPARDGARAYDLVVYLTSNVSEATLAVQGADIQEIIVVAVHTLNPQDDLVPNLKSSGMLIFRGSRKGNELMWNPLIIEPPLCQVDV